MFLISWTLQSVTMASALDESREISTFLASTGSSIYTQIGRYLLDLEFTADILDDEDGDFSDLFGEDDDCRRIGIPMDDGLALRDFVVFRCEQMIVDYSKKRKSRRLLLMAERLWNALSAQNSLVYREIGRLLFEYQAHCGDIVQADDLRLFLSTTDLVRMGLKNRAKQKLAFAKVMRVIAEVQKQPPITDEVVDNETEQSIGTELLPQNDNAADSNSVTADDDGHSDENGKSLGILREMVNIGTVSAAVFWSYFFKEVCPNAVDRKFAANTALRPSTHSLTHSLTHSVCPSMDSKNG